MPKRSHAKLYLAYWDDLGFECIIDLTSYDKKLMWASLSNKQIPNEIPLHQMLMRARLNPQRLPEIWTFQSYLDYNDLMVHVKSNPDGLVNLIRENGTKVFKTT